MNLKTRLIVLAFTLALTLSLLPSDSAAAQKAVPDTTLELAPQELLFNSASSLPQDIVVQARWVFNFYAAEFVLEFDPNIVQATQVQSGPAFGHADMAGAPYIVIDNTAGTVTFANTRFDGPIDFASTLELATITLQPTPLGQTGTSSLTWKGTDADTRLVDPQGNTIPQVTYMGGDANVLAGTGLAGRALLQGRGPGDHDGTVVNLCDAAGNCPHSVSTDPDGNYSFTAVQVDGAGTNCQLRIVPQFRPALGFTDPYLQTWLQLCPAPPVGTGIVVHDVELPGGDVDNDWDIDIADLVRCANLYGSTGTKPEDINNDKVVNISDIVIISANFGQVGPIVQPCS